MTKEAKTPVDERIVQVLRHLGIARAHVGARMAPDWQGLATREADLIASLTLVCPPAIDSNVLSPVASRLVVFTGDQGRPAEQLRRSLAGLPDATLVTLRDYLGVVWADVAADRTQEVGTAMLDSLQRADLRHRGKAVVLPEGEGEVAGIAYRIRGAGPPLVLLPLALAPSQWEPLIPMLSAHYCTIILSGAALGVVALLEERGRSGYLGAVRNLMDAVHVRRGEVVLEVGCGSGVLVRWLARQTNGANRIVGVDISRYLLQEAAALARKEGLADAITFQEGNAEALPFPDNSVDVTMASDAAWRTRGRHRANRRRAMGGQPAVASGAEGEGRGPRSYGVRRDGPGLCRCEHLPAASRLGPNPPEAISPVRCRHQDGTAVRHLSTPEPLNTQSG